MADCAIYFIAGLGRTVVIGLSRFKSQGMKARFRNAAAADDEEEEEEESGVGI